MCCQNLIDPGDHVLDVGANIGVFAVQAIALGAIVTCVEMDAYNCEVLNHNLRLNKYSATVHHAALGGARGEIRYERDVDSTNAVAGANGSLTAPMKLIDDFVSDRLDLLKIDVEGYEYRILSVARLLWKRNPIIITEYSPLFEKSGSGVEGADYLKLFVSRNYRLVVLRPLGQPTEYVGRDISAVDSICHELLTGPLNWNHVDILCLPDR